MTTLAVPSTLAPLRAVLLREIRGAVSSRYFQVFCAISVIGGVASVAFAGDSGLFILQLALYFVSLFALLLGVNSARAESEEWPLLFAQPVPRSAYLLGKFLALSLIFASALLLLFLPAFVASPATAPLLSLYFHTFELAAFFASVGLAAGYFARERIQGLILAVTVWLFLLVGFDLIALFGARWSTLQEFPDGWLALLMLNPLDAFRVHALFSMEQIPAELAGKTALAAWWIDHAGLWFGLLAPAWISLLLWNTARRLRQWED
ncbi:MAG: ABC transporter permease subunit [Chthoniobacterales bacterium]